MKLNKTVQPRAIESLFNKLDEQKESNQQPFPPKGPVKTTNRHGIYIILRDNKQVLHVGRTARNVKGLQGRLQAHLAGNSSFTKKYMKGKGSKLRDAQYSYALLEVEDPFKRAYLEALAIGKYCPRHIGTGAKSNLKG